ncbi:MAG: aldo/keto reductase [Acidimicrobiia bacterium]
MQQRTLGRTGLSVSEIGYGAWGIGGSSWIGASEEESLAALHTAIDRGVNFIDTARVYGQSERIVGEVVREHQGDGVIVATKVPPKVRGFPPPPGTDPMEMFPGEHIRASLDESLRASGLDRFDVLQFHVWDDDWVGRGDWLETIGDLKQQGKIGFFGVSVNDYQPQNALELVRTDQVDTIQVVYNAFTQAAAEELLPLCAERNVGVIVRVPLDEGGLTGRITASSTFPEGDFRNMYFGGGRAAEVERRATALAADLGVAPTDLPELALRFVLDSPEVSTVIVGMRTRDHVERNTSISDGARLSTAQRDIFKRHRWERNFAKPA